MAIPEETSRTMYRQREQEKGRPGEGKRPHVHALILLAVIAFSAVPSLATDTEGSTTNPTVVITEYTVSPAVLLPGDRGTITMTIRNTAQSATVKENSGITAGGSFAVTRNTDINVYIERVNLDGNGIIVLTDTFDRLGELGPGQSVPVTFVIQAPARDGIYFPEAWIDVKNGRSTRYPMTVNVNTDISTQKKPALTVTQDLPAGVAPGEDCSAGITIANTGLLRAGDITVTANSSTPSLVLTTSARYYAEHLDPGETTNFTLRFATDRNTPLGIDPVILQITYRNPDGSTERQTETVGIPVRGKAAIAVKSLVTDPVRPVPGNAFTLVIRVENTGTDRATSVRAGLESPFAGTDTAFIGSIDKNSDAPAVFYLQDTRDGTVPVNVTIRYADDYGSHELTEHATVTTAPPSVLVPAVIVLLAAGILGGTAYWYFRIRPGKRNGG